MIDWLGDDTMQNTPNPRIRDVEWPENTLGLLSFAGGSGPSGFSESAAPGIGLLPPRDERRRTEKAPSISGENVGDLGLSACGSIDPLTRGREIDLTIEDTLSLLLGFTDLVAEVRVTSQHLLKHFGSLGAVLGASQKSLKNLLSECPEAIALLRGVQQAMVLTLRETMAERPLLQNTTALRDYLRISLAQEEREIVRLLFLDSRNALILDEMHSQGSVNHAPIYPREIVRRLIETNATALIIVHNHPSGDPTPSADDIEMTRRLAGVLTGIGVKLQDSVVVGRRGQASLRSLGFI